MPYCSKCGATMLDTDKFCPKCGNPAPGQPQQGYEQNTQQAQNSQNTQQAYQSNAFADGVNNIINDAQNTADYTNGYNFNDIAANKGISILSYIGILFFIPLLTKKDSPFARFHVNQGIILFLSEIIINVVLGIIKGIFSVASNQVVFFGGLTAAITAITSLFSVIFLVFMIMGIVNAAQGKAKELPLIGKIRILK